MRKKIAHFGEAEISSQLGTRSFVDVTLDKEDDDILIVRRDEDVLGVYTRPWSVSGIGSYERNSSD